MSTLLEYKCPCCGGKIEFDSTQQKMVCPFCDTSFDVDTLKKYDEQLNNKQEDKLDWEESAGSQWAEGETDGMRVYTCQSCGGEVVGDANTAATACPFCDNPVIMTGQFMGDLKPDYVIPFKLDKETAKASLTKHFKGKILLPKVFKDQNHIDEIKGIYVPFWLFDADADADIHYKATRVRHWSDSNYRYTETKFYSVHRAGTIGFNRIPVDGSSKMDDDLMESIEPYNTNDMVDFQTAYLSGYLSDKYDVDEASSVGRANERVKASTESMFASTVQGFNTVVPDRTRIQLSNSKAKYALYPVWILNTSWNNTKYTFAMNGQTGKFVGNLPMDKGLFAKYLAGITAGATALAFGIQYLLWLL